jgi:hypothetical protein
LLPIFSILEAESFGVAELQVVLSSEVCFRASPFSLCCVFEGDGETERENMLLFFVCL